MAFVISPSIVINELVTPLTHARIGYDNFVPSSVVTATTEAVGFPADAVQRQTTWERWKPTALPATLSIDSGTAPSGTGSYIGIAAHTLGSSSATIAFEYSVNGTDWTTVETLAPANNSAIMIIFAEVQAQYWRIVVSGSTVPNIGSVYIGVTLDMERPIYGGHSPISLSRQTVVRPTESEKGQWLGRSVIRYGLQTSYAWKNLTAAWYRANFDLFVREARFHPFFIAWRPADFPLEVAYGWTSQDIQPINSGTRDLMSVSISVSAYADE